MNIDAVLAKWKIHYTTMTPTAANHALTECSHPKMGSLATGATGMIIYTYFLDQLLVNSLVNFSKTFFTAPHRTVGERCLVSL